MKRLLTASAFACLALFPLQALALDPNPVVAQNPWAAHDAKQKTAIKHASYDALLQALVVDDGATTQVAFGIMTQPGKDLMDQYITWLSGLPVSQLNRDEQVAYWLNLHNVLTLRELDAVGGKGPVDRYRQFPISTTGAFAKPVVTVEGRQLSIDGIVQEVLRPNFKDYPYQYGVFLAAKGAPSLRREAYLGSKVREQLQDQARRFVNNGGAKAKGNGLELSSFYEWWGADLGGSEPGVRQHLLQYAEPKLAAKISSASDSYSYRFDRAIPAFQPRLALESGAAAASGGGFSGAVRSSGSPGGGTQGGGS